MLFTLPQTLLLNDDRVGLQITIRENNFLYDCLTLFFLGAVIIELINDVLPEPLEPTIAIEKLLFGKGSGKLSLSLSNLSSKFIF